MTSRGPRSFAGSASSLYGNSSGGVVSFKTIGRGARTGHHVRPRRRRLLRIRQGECPGHRHRRAGVRHPLGVVHQLERLPPAQRQPDFITLALGGDWAISGHTSLAARIRYTDQPFAQNPGALTFAEYQANPDSAAANQHPPERRQGREPGPGRAHAAPCHQRRRRIPGDGLRPVAHPPERPGGVAARRAVAAERRHLCDHRPHDRRPAADRHQPAGRQRQRIPAQLWPRPPGACATTAPTPHRSTASRTP